MHLKKAAALWLLGILLLALAALVLAYGAFNAHVETYRDNNVSAGRIRGPLRIINPHADQEHYLKVHGKVYDNVRGIEPYYLDISEMHSILFVTEDHSNNAKFHIVNLVT
jgi:hypothetical protein